MKHLDKYDVPQEVVKSVNEYFSLELPLFIVEEVTRHSNHPADHYLYHVLARKAAGKDEGTYSCWTSWNQSTKSLNYGHYHIETREEAQRILDEFYYMVTPES